MCFVCGVSLFLGRVWVVFMWGLRGFPIWCSIGCFGVFGCDFDVVWDDVGSDFWCGCWFFGWFIFKSVCGMIRYHGIAK